MTELMARLRNELCGAHRRAGEPVLGADEALHLPEPH